MLQLFDEVCLSSYYKYEEEFLAFTSHSHETSQFVQASLFFDLSTPVRGQAAHTYIHTSSTRNNILITARK